MNLLTDWMTKPHFLFTPLDSFVAIIEILCVIFAGKVLYEIVKVMSRRK